MGLKNVRVRHYDETARIEVSPEEFDTVLENSESIVAKLEEFGYQYVTLDLNGLRSGNLNKALVND